MARPSDVLEAREKGREFEKEIADQLDLGLVPASGSTWHSKLDLKGRKTRWSLKYTGLNSFKIDRELLAEAVDATEGLEGDGSIPLWAVRIGGLDETLIIMRLGDFKLIQEGETLLDVLPSRSDTRRARASVPVLLREEEE